jgi:hypothetical protein
MGKFSQLEVILSQNHQKTRFFTFDEGGWSKNDNYGLWLVGRAVPCPPFMRWWPSARTGAHGVMRPIPQSVGDDVRSLWPRPGFEMSLVTSTPTKKERMGAGESRNAGGCDRKFVVLQMGQPPVRTSQSDRMTIARHFNAGVKPQKIQVPKGRQNIPK